MEASGRPRQCYRGDFAEKLIVVRYLYLDLNLVKDSPGLPLRIACQITKTNILE